MPPPGWKTCPHCNAAFSPLSIDRHERRCKDRADVKAEHAALQELRKIEGPRPKALPDWPKCPNCGEPYGPHAIGPHTKRCVKLLPHGANGYGPQDHHKDPRFKHLYKAAQINLKDEAPSLVESVGDALSALGKSVSSVLAALGPQISEAEMSRLRKLFRRFDANGDELLDREEFGVLMRNCFPSRVADADSLCSSMFDDADVDDSGAISFEEFVKHYLAMKQPDVDPRFEEACTMFEFFDADWSGSLDPDELMCLLNQIFPERCDENEERARELFCSMDTDGSGAISFPEFVAYFDTLKNLYDGSPPPEAAASAPTAEELAAAAAREQAELEAALVTCRCGLRFLPTVMADCI